MTNKRTIILFWALFLIPTLIMAGTAARLLFHEQERINRSTLTALTDRAESIADAIHLTVEAVKDNLIRSLAEIPPEKLDQTLPEWAESNPLVRNIFIFKDDKTLAYPVRGMSSTAEERLFITRYDALFSGRVPFKTVLEEKVNAAKQAGSRPAPEYETQKTSRNQLLTLSKSSPEPFETESGWLPWFFENQLHILIWVKISPSGPIYGLELELMTLLSRLSADFPEMTGTASSLVLMDGNNHHYHRFGSMDVTKETKPAAPVTVSPLLPHWQIIAFTDPKGISQANGFLILSLILVGIFMAAIISGGVFLTRMTLKNIKDAQQKTSFVSSVSHELKTPLTSIRMYAELLLSGRIKDAAKKETYLSVIMTESERLTRLINNVLDFGKLEQGKKAYHIIGFDLHAMLHQIIDVHKIRIKEKGMNIITEVKQGSYSIHSDRDALEQVILNLMDNVLKYAGKGKFIKFILQKEPDGTFLFKICDDGQGIPKSQREMIFEKFFRIDNSLTSAQPGSGLGLSIARKIMRDLKGDLYYDPTEPNGACFTARIKNYETD
ncbi:MAG: HAMP domain-containing sensor histidine kinase [Desulfobacula sp.]|jgi:signal transduction histidine kinase